MLDFFCTKVTHRPSKRGNPEDFGEITVFPEFIVGPSRDLMVKGKSFYAIWDEDLGMWSKDESLVCRKVDEALELKAKQFLNAGDVKVSYLKNFSSKKWTEYLAYVGSLPDNYIDLDTEVTFANTEVRKDDYVSKRLDYPLAAGRAPAYEEIISTLYDPIERKKIEWTIGAILTGESKNIQKLLVLYGKPGAGKSTVLNIMQMLFEGYYVPFESKQLCVKNSSFALEAFKNNPLLAIDHDGDLSSIQDETIFDKVVSHEILPVNEKFKSLYHMRFNSFMVVATNKPVRITHANAGIVRRLIDVQPTGHLVKFERYQTLMAQIKFELGAIASHCIDVYSEIGADAYANYVAIDMLGATNHIYNFISDNYRAFADDDGITLVEAWTMYKQFCHESDIAYPYNRMDFKEELKKYYREFYERKHVLSGWKRNLYLGFIRDTFAYSIMEGTDVAVSNEITLDMRKQNSIFDSVRADALAQYASDSEVPILAWSKVKTKLSDLDTSELHYVIPGKSHIVIDFDIKDETGEKNLDRNLAAASKWPATYSELSKSGKGVHLHYIYGGDVSKLANEYSEGIEIKVFNKGQSLRRKLSRCNNLDIATINSGLPEKKGGKDMLAFDTLKNEKALRTLIKKNLNKEIHPGTKPSIDFINTILNDAYNSGMHYDVTDMRQAILTFANNSSNHNLYCIKLVNKMPFHSEEPSDAVAWDDDTLIFYDVEVFPNLFVVCYKNAGADNKVVRMINPGPMEIEDLLKHKLVGFNNRKYDNHILYGRLMGYSNAQLYNQSQKIISNSKNAMFIEAYGLSYTDIYDFSSKKQSLKKWQIELGLVHKELGLDWNTPVPENLWDKVAEYCENDVVTTEQLFYHLEDDFTARQIISVLSGLSVNDTTNKHSARIMFGTDKDPQREFVYTDLSKEFPGYKFENGVSTYKGEVVGEGGYVRAEPGYYVDVHEFDIESMHPTTIEVLNLFGIYTPKYTELKTTRLAIKHEDFEAARAMFDGKLIPYLEHTENGFAVAYALKIIINSVYGMTAAPFKNPFRDVRNVDNIVAKRGALFMVDLAEALNEQGSKPIHIKTDSVKVSKPDAKLVAFIKAFGKKYGYNFEEDNVFEKFCLVNDAVYIAREAESKKWHAVGAQFAEPYVFKTLFSNEELEFRDFIQVKHVTSPAAIYLDLEEQLAEDEHDYHFVGKAGAFVPVIDGANGGRLMRMKEDKYYYVSGTKGYRWLESEVAKAADKSDQIDIRYFDKLVNASKEAINAFVPFEEFVA